MNTFSGRSGWTVRWLVLACVVSFSALIPSPGRGDDATSGKLAAELIRRGGVERGICAVLGRDGNLAVELARASGLLVHVRDPRDSAVAELRQSANAAGFQIDRLVVEQGSLKKLPYAANTVDVLISTQATSELLQSLAAAEILRVLRPDGVAIVGKPLQSQGPDVAVDELKEWASKSGASGVQAGLDDFGAWVQFTKPPLVGADDWSHWEKSPDNNPVSNDTLIKAPYLTQFMAEPYYIGMPSITTAAGGRTFLAIGHIAHHEREWEYLNRIIARNGYNGAVLWERKLPEGYLVHRSAFIATKDTFHMIDGERCLLLDAKTGKEQGEIRIEGLTGEWKWMAMVGDVLYVLAGKPDGGVTTVKGDRTFGGWSWEDLSKEYYGAQIPVGFGDTLAAYDLKNKERLWIHKEETLIDSRGLALRDDKCYLYCPDRHYRCLDARTGEVVWTNGGENVFGLIEQPGKGLTSTPGWRTQTLVVATPDALVIQGQTRMNVVALATDDGRLLWTKRKITNNPNAIYVDGNIILGVGEQGNHVVIEPLTGEVKDNLHFGKVACTRLTACSDSFFVRGEGMLRYDRDLKKVLIDGAARPACNDGAMPANGLLYLGPWSCDCNLSLIGNIAKCSAGDFQFDIQATDDDRLIRSKLLEGIQFIGNPEDDGWPTYRGNNQRSSSTKVEVPSKVQEAWQYSPAYEYSPSAPVSGGQGMLIFVSGDDGKVRAINARDGALRWEFATAGPIKYPPTINKGRAFFGSGDGHVYCVTIDGQLLWRFRAAPIERHIMVYGHLQSTWPAASGVLVDDGVAYCAAGIIDSDGTYVYALNAEDGSLIWQNTTSGHLNAELRKGVSVQGNLSILGGQLLLAGGNQVSPAQFDLKTGECKSPAITQGGPKANNGRFVGVFQDKSVIVGGRVLYSAAENVSTKGYFGAFTKNHAFSVAYGGIPPAWSDETVALVNYQHGKLTICDADKVAERLEKGPGESTAAPGDRRRINLATALENDKAIRWQSNLNEAAEFEAVSIVVGPNAVVAVVKSQQQFRARPQWYVVALEAATGQPMFQHELRDDPLPDSLLVDASGQIVVTMLNGNVLCLKGA